MAPIGSRLADPPGCAQAGFRAASVPGSIRGNCSNSRTGESKINQAWTQNSASASHKQAEAPASTAKDLGKVIGSGFSSCCFGQRGHGRKAHRFWAGAADPVGCFRTCGCWKAWRLQARQSTSRGGLGGVLGASRRSTVTINNARQLVASGVDRSANIHPSDGLPATWHQGRKSSSFCPQRSPSICAKCASRVSSPAPCSIALAAIHKSLVGIGWPLRRRPE